MSAPVAEIFKFTTSEAYRKDPSGVFAELLGIVAKKEGQIKTYHGLQSEDPNQGYLIVVWEKYEHHAAVIADPSYAALVESLKPGLGGPYEMLHVLTTSDPTPVFDAPITEVAYFTLQSGKTKDDIAPLLAEREKQIKKVAVSAAWGPTREKDDQVVLLIGWDSIEAHAQAAQSFTAEDQVTLRNQLSQVIGGVSVGHVKLSTQ